MQQRDLAAFTFKGQCYDAGSDSKTPCAFCGRPVRKVFHVKDAHGVKTLIGPHEFGRFKFTNPILYKQLQCSLVWLDTMIAAEEKDLGIFVPKTEVKDKMAAWRKLKQQALRKIRDYRKATGEDWLPKDLYNLNEAATRLPAAYKRASAAKKFYDEQIRILEEGIHSIK